MSLRPDPKRDEQRTVVGQQAFPVPYSGGNRCAPHKSGAVHIVDQGAREERTRWRLTVGKHNRLKRRDRRHSSLVHGWFKPGDASLKEISELQGTPYHLPPPPPPEGWGMWAALEPGPPDGEVGFPPATLLARGLARSTGKSARTNPPWEHALSTGGCVSFPHVHEYPSAVSLKARPLQQCRYRVLQYLPPFRLARAGHPIPLVRDPGNTREGSGRQRSPTRRCRWRPIREWCYRIAGNTRALGLRTHALERLWTLLFSATGKVQTPSGVCVYGTISTTMRARMTAGVLK